MTTKTSNPLSGTARLAARLGSLSGQLYSACAERHSYTRCREEFEHEVVFGILPRTEEAAKSFQDAWFTAWERAAARMGMRETHLTAPAARARA